MPKTKKYWITRGCGARVTGGVDNIFIWEEIDNPKRKVHERFPKIVTYQGCSTTKFSMGCDNFKMLFGYIPQEDRCDLREITSIV